MQQCLFSACFDAQLSKRGSAGFRFAASQVVYSILFYFLSIFQFCEQFISEVFTWLGLFGHRLQKGTNLWVALPGAQALSRRMTKARRAAFVKRQSQSSGGGHRDYTRHEDGTVSGGPDLQSSAIYPAPFCRQVFKVAKLVLAGFCML